MSTNYFKGGAMKGITEILRFALEFAVGGGFALAMIAIVVLFYPH